MQQGIVFGPAADALPPNAPAASKLPTESSTLMPTNQRTFLVTGTNRGIGLAICQHLVAQGHRVLAISRGETICPGVARSLRVDVTDFATAPSAIEQFVSTESVDVLINNAGVSSTQKTLGELTGEELQRVFAVNSTAPMIVVRAVVAALRRGQAKKIVNISSQLGSITNNTGGSTYAYRASKAAINMLSVSLANELKPEGFTVLTIHPGWVKTDMGGPNAPVLPTDSAAKLIEVIERSTPAETGSFLTFEGVKLPW